MSFFNRCTWYLIPPNIISATLGYALIGGIQKAIHLWFFKVRNRSLTWLFERDGAKLSGPTDILRTTQGHEPGEGVNGR